MVVLGRGVGIGVMTEKEVDGHRIDGATSGDRVTIVMVFLALGL